MAAGSSKNSSIYSGYAVPDTPGPGVDAGRGSDPQPQGQLPLPLLSVVVPVHNAAKYVEACIQSLSEQGLGGHALEAPAGAAQPAPDGTPDAQADGSLQPAAGMEIIFVDDCSTDRTCACIQEEQQAHPELAIHLIHRPENGGAGAARNDGIDAAKGRYLYFFDCDDSLEPGSLHTLVQQMESGQLDVLFFSGDVVFEAGSQGKNPVHGDYLKRIPDTAVCSGADAFCAQAEAGRFCAQPCVLMCRTAYVQENPEIRFPTHIINEDNIFVLAATVHARRASTNPAVLYHYHVYPDSVTARFDKGARRYTANLFISDTLRYYAYVARSQGNGRLEHAMCLVDYYYSDAALRAVENLPDAELPPLMDSVHTARVNELRFYHPLRAYHQECEQLRSRIEALEKDSRNLPLYVAKRVFRWMRRAGSRAKRLIRRGLCGLRGHGK